jgi:sugar phosphate isomerase/epimerase
MDNYTRRHFLQKSSPDWSFDKIINFAVLNGYDGIELRGIQREMELTKVKELSTAQSRRETLQIMTDRGLHFVDLGSSAALHFAEHEERLKNIDEGRRFIDLAEQLDCPFIRVFPNNFPDGVEKAVTINLTKGLLELADHAKGSKVSVLMESHGDLVKTSDLATIMISVNHTNAGMIWDVTNMWTITREPPKEVYKVLRRYIKHTHIKDAKIVDNKEQYVLLGRGDVPIFEAIDALAEGGYQGYYSFEWEKLWHPEIGDPEIALADYVRLMKTHFS